MPKKQFNEPEEKAPPKKASHTFTLTPSQLQKVRDHCYNAVWDQFHPEYSIYAFRNDARKVVVTAYASGKLVVAGRGSEEFITDFLEPQVTGEARLGYDEVHHPEWFEPHAGLDEAGKGDVFGPVVACTVVAPQSSIIKSWIEAGVKDSKSLNDNVILKLDKIIRETKGAVVEVSLCDMHRYNELMLKPRANMNLMLAWLHAKALEKALSQAQVPWALLDQFSKLPLVQRYFKDKTFDLRMRTKAESDPVVAAASVCARAEFVRQMNSLSKLAGETLRKGASSEVRKQGVGLVQKFGPGRLGDFAKLHFKTSYEILGLPPPPSKFKGR